MVLLGRSILIMVTVIVVVVGSVKTTLADVKEPAILAGYTWLEVPRKAIMKMTIKTERKFFFIATGF
jgi:hypothetical protein